MLQSLTTARCGSICLLVAALLVAPALRGEEPPAEQEQVEVVLEACADAETGAKATTFRIEGRTDLPDHTRLLLVLWYEGALIYRSWRRIEVAGGRFQATVGPVRDVALAGTYDAQILFIKADQPAQLRRILKRVRDRIEIRASCFLGTPEEEAEVDAAHRKFLLQSARQLESLYADLIKRHDAYVAGTEKFSREEFFHWADDLVNGLGGMRDSLQDYDETRLFACRYPEMVRDISVVLSILDLLATQYLQEIAREWGVEESLPDTFRAEPVCRIVPAEYRLEIERRFRELAKREESPEEVTAFDLYQDLLAVSELRLQIGRKYQVHRQNLDPAEWEPWHQSWLLRLRRARENADRYAERPLAEKFAVHEEFAALIDDLVTLGNHYFVDLYASQDAALPPGTPRPDGSVREQDEKIRLRWGKLFEVVQVERKRVHGKLREAFQQVEGEAAGVCEKRELYEGKKLSAEEWRRAAEQAEARLGPTRTSVLRVKEEPLLERFFPGTLGGIVTYLDCLQRRLVEYRALDAGTEEERELHESRGRYLDRVIQQVRTRVERDLNRKDELIQ
jgi:hypothetical protein